MPNALLYRPEGEAGPGYKFHIREYFLVVQDYTSEEVRPPAKLIGYS
eukprot:SAG11_NODE_1411_length_4995_cov_21.158088_5_plen_47_part_00